MKKTIIMIMLVLSSLSVAAQQNEVKLLAEYKDVTLFVLDVQPSKRSFLKIPIWKITYHLSGESIEGVEHNLNSMQTQKCEQVKNDIKKGQTYTVTVKKFEKKLKTKTTVFYNINPKEIGVTCYYDWHDL